MIRRNPQEYIDQSIVTQLRKQGLLVVQRIGGDNLRRCVGNLDREEFFAGNDAVQPHLPESIGSATGALEDPFESFGGGLLNDCR